jgi:WD40 repeat protein
LVKTWDSQTGREVALLRGHHGPVASVHWGGEERNLISGGSDGTVKLWDSSAEPAFHPIAGAGPVAWSPDGQLLATGTQEPQEKSGFVDIFEAATGRKIQSLPFEGHESLHGVAWSPDNQRVAAALGRPGGVVVWNRSSGQQVLNVVAHDSEARSVAWSPDGRLLASGGLDYLVHLWDVDTERKIFTFSEHRDNIGSVLWSPDGKRIASRSWAGEIKVWEPSTGEVLLALSQPKGSAADGQYSISWSPGGDRLAACYTHGEIIVWDASTGRKIHQILGHTSDLRAVAWSPDGKRLASGGYDRFVKIWDAQTGRELLALPGHQQIIYSLAWSPDGKRLATADKTKGNVSDISALGGVKIWDASTGYSLKTVSEPLRGQGPATAP